MLLISKFLDFCGGRANIFLPPPPKKENKIEFASSCSPNLIYEFTPSKIEVGVINEIPGWGIGPENKYAGLISSYIQVFSWHQSV